MAQTGHAEDCPACMYAELPDEDRSGLEPLAFTVHTRREPPWQPSPPYWPFAILAAGLLLLGVSGWLGGLTVLAGFVLWGMSIAKYKSDEARQRPLYEAWKAEQTQAWLQQRAMAELWPCPSCGDFSCSNQHSVTNTRTVKTSPWSYRSESHTDPR